MMPLITHPIAFLFFLPIAEAPADMNTFQKISLFLGMMILTYTVIRIGLRRRRALAGGASGQPSPRREFTRAPARTVLFGGGATTGGGGPELEGLVVSLREAGREIEARLDTKIRYAQRLMEEAQQTLTELEVARARAEALARGTQPQDPTAQHRAELAAAETSLQRAEELKRQQQEEREARRKREREQPKSFFAPVDDDESGEGDESDESDESDDEETFSKLRTANDRDLDPSLDATQASEMGRRARTLEAAGDSDEDRAGSPIPKTRETESQARVRRLADEGKSAREIAIEVERPVGEIELILALGRGSDSEESP